MSRKHFSNSRGRQVISNVHMQTVSSRASLDLVPGQTGNWQDHGWDTTPFQETSELSDQTDKSIKLPFSPDNKEKEDIRNALEDISSYQNEEQERIYRHAKDFYADEVETIDTEDIVNICQILEFANEKDYEDWESRLKGKVIEFFENGEVGPVFLEPSDKDDVANLDIEGIRQALQKRRQDMREAISEVYGSPDEEPNASLISESQKSYLRILLQNSDQINSLPL